MCTVIIGAMEVAGIVRAAVGLTPCLVGIAAKQKANSCYVGVRSGASAYNVRRTGAEFNLRLIDELE